MLSLIKYLMLELKKKMDSNNLKTSLAFVFLCKRMFVASARTPGTSTVSSSEQSVSFKFWNHRCQKAWPATVNGCVYLVVIPRVILWCSNKSHSAGPQPHLWCTTHTVFIATTSTAQSDLSLPSRGNKSPLLSLSKCHLKC